MSWRDEIGFKEIDDIRKRLDRVDEAWVADVMELERLRAKVCTCGMADRNPPDHATDCPVSGTDEP